MHTRISSWIKHHFGGSSRAFADHVGLEVEWVDHDRPGRSWPIFFRGEINTSRLASQLTTRGVRRWRMRCVPGLEDWRYTKPKGSRLHAALKGLRGLDSLPEGTEVKDLVRWIASCARVSDDTVRRWVRQTKHAGEGTIEAILRVWHDACAFDRRERVEAMAATIAEPETADAAEVEALMTAVDEHGIEITEETTPEQLAALILDAQDPGRPVVRDLPGVVARIVEEDVGQGAMSG